MPPDPGFVSESIRGITVSRPADWEVLEKTPQFLAVASPPVPEGIFRPSLVVRSEPGNGASILRLSTAGLAATMVQFEDLHVISSEDWPKPGPRPGGQAVPGRRHRFVYLAGPHTVCVDRWIWTGTSRSVEATASYAVEQHTGLKLLFEHLVAGLQLDVDADPDGEPV